MTSVHFRGNDQARDFSTATHKFPRDPTSLGWSLQRSRPGPPTTPSLTMCPVALPVKTSIHYSRTNPPTHTHDVTACYPSAMSVFQKDGTQFKTEIFPFQDASSPMDRVAKKGRADRDSERQSLCISFPSPTYCLIITLK
ncbi:hypothetical protein MRS44_012806 [Fusarium solani]|uniref:uncharacterized protein n=1 Tax=Fusarium solani TaxID=169388 RepID=UPI0032C447AE|nr:hypothetical protein MRS44_012806 [Fusarium solani]